MVIGLEWRFLQRRYTNDQKIHEKGSTSPITRNTNQSHGEIPPRPHYLAAVEKTDNKCWWECGETGTLCTVGGNIAAMEKRKVPQKIKNRTTMLSTNLTSGYASKKLESGSPREICTPMFTAAWFTIAKVGETPARPHVHCDVPIQWNVSRQRAGNPAVCNNMDGPGEHCAKLNKADTEGQILQDSTMWAIK